MTRKVNVLGVLFSASLMWLYCVVGAQAHEVRPAFLRVTETAPAEFAVLWKQPVTDGKRLKITPEFPADCTQSTAQVSITGLTISESFTVSCALKSGDIRLDGLERTLTDIFVDIHYLDGSARQSLVKPSAPVLSLDGPKESAASHYLWLGVEHIIFGWDHLLFVIGLTLLVARRQILGVATAFTVAHSITLVLAALGMLSIPIRAVEILIAASIVMLGVEIMRKLAGQESLATRRPYLISFIIGLIHGCGFASALSDIGLPRGTELLALLLFNIGVELGQFAVVGLIVLVLGAVARWASVYMRRVEIAGAYFISAIAAFWVIERLAQYTA